MDGLKDKFEEMMVNYKMMNDDIEFRKKDSYEKNQLIEKMKEKMVEY